MGQTLGIDRDLARKIKRMSRKELDGYLTRVTDKSYNNGYEQGLVEGIALAGQAMDEILKEEVIKGTFPAEKVDEIKKAVGTYIARVPERAAEKDKDEGKKKDAGSVKCGRHFCQQSIYSWQDEGKITEDCVQRSQESNGAGWRIISCCC